MFVPHWVCLGELHNKIQGLETKHNIELIPQTNPIEAVYIFIFLGIPNPGM